MFDAPPEAFGSYRVLDAIGGGRFGPVYRARDAATGELVAIKVFDQGLTAERAAVLAEALDRLCRAPLDHPVIVPRLVSGTLDDHAWVAEPWLEALPLDYVMRHGGALPLGDVLLRITQVAGALDFAAAAGICHGALHPRDILVSDDWTRLTGVGVLQALGEAGLDVPMTGAYVSPQRAAGEAPTPSDDIFAIAAITYELVYGTPVPEGSALRASMTRLTGVDHARFVELLERALSPDAADRPATALAFAGALQQVVVEEPAVQDAAPDSDSIPRDEPARDAADDLPLRSTEIEWDAEREPDVHADAAPIPDLAFAGPLEDRNAGEAKSPLRDLRDLPVNDAPPRSPESTSGYWFPVAAALAIGILAGFAGGFVVGQRDATPAPLAAERVVRRSAPAGETPAPTAGREFTEADVPAATRRDRDAPAAVTEEQIVAGGTATTAPAPLPGGEEPRGPNDVPRPGNPNGEPGTRNQEPGAAAARTAILEVDSRPRGASVFVDGRLVGRTPLVLDDVRPGSYAVRIDLVGHRRWVTSVDVAPGVRRRVAASLER